MAGSKKQPHLPPLLLVEFLLAAPPAAFDVEPGLELLQAGEDPGEDEVEQRPELLQVVLEGRARQEQPVVRGQLLELGKQLAVLVLQPVALDGKTMLRI